MPQWGRPPGAHMGINRRGWKRQSDRSARVEELDSDDYDDDVDVDGGEEGVLLAPSFGPEAWKKDRLRITNAEKQIRKWEGEYGDDADIDGDEYGMHDAYPDSTVAYAMELAMKDDEDLLVENALDRIRRAQMSGRAKVKLSPRELAALEKRRRQGYGASPTGRRRGSSIAEQQGYYGPPAGLPPSPYSQPRSRTPSVQSLHRPMPPPPHPPHTPPPQTHYQQYPYPEQPHWMPSSPSTTHAVPQSPYQPYAQVVHYPPGYGPPGAPSAYPGSPNVIYQPVYRPGPLGDPFVPREPDHESPTRRRTTSGSSSSDTDTKITDVKKTDVKKKTASPVVKKAIKTSTSSKTKPTKTGTSSSTGSDSKGSTRGKQAKNAR